jgi:hypothetical protein
MHRLHGLFALSMLGVAPGLSAQCGSAWASLPGFRVQGAVHALRSWDPDGAGPAPTLLVVAGAFRSAGGIEANHVVGYEPATGSWVPLGSGVDGPVHALAVLPDNRLVAAGSFGNAGATVAGGIAAWNGIAWQPLGAGVAGGAIESLVVGTGGDLFAGGTFTQAGGVPASLVARWDGSAWSPLGAGLTPAAATPVLLPGVRDLDILPNGDLIAVGGFTGSGPTAAEQVARWDGVAWSGVNPPWTLTANGVLHSLTRSAGGVVVAGSDTPSILHRFDGVAWTALPAPVGEPGIVEELANGDLILITTTGAVRRLRGTTWTSLGGFALPSGQRPCVVDLPGSPAGHFVLGGSFTAIPGVRTASIATWNGAAWTGSAPFFDNVVRCSVAGPDGTIYLGGDFTSVGGAPIQRVVRFDGVAWSQVGGGLPGSVTSLAVLDDGDLFAAVSPNGYRYSHQTGTWTQQPGMPFGTFVRGPGDRLAIVGASIWLRTPTGWQSTGAVNLASNLGATFARDGSLLACGYRAFPGFFTHVGRWTGSGWVPLDPNGQIFSSFPNSIQELPNGEIVVGGELYQPGGGVVRLVGTTWQQLGPGAGVGITVSRLYTLPDGSLLAMGNLPLGPAGLRFRRWDGVQWQPYPTVPADGFTSLVVHPAGDLLLTGTTNGPIEGFARLQSNCRPAAQVVQPGCTGGALPRLVAPVWPRLGTTSVTRASELPNAALVVTVSSFVGTQQPLAGWLPNARPGCTLLVLPDVAVLSFAAGGISESTLSIPLQAALLGLTIHQQVVPFALDAQGAVTEVTATPALQLTIGGGV